MELIMPILAGLLYAAGVYLMIHRDFMKLMLGFVLLGNATVLLLFLSGRLVRDHAPLIPEGHILPLEPFADPLPQALGLTALVIGFGLQAFAFVLFKKAYERLGTSDSDQLKES